MTADRFGPPPRELEPSVEWPLRVSNHANGPAMVVGLAAFIAMAVPQGYGLYVALPLAALMLLRIAYVMFIGSGARTVRLLRNGRAAKGRITAIHFKAGTTPHGCVSAFSTATSYFFGGIFIGVPLMMVSLIVYGGLTGRLRDQSGAPADTLDTLLDGAPILGVLIALGVFAVVWTRRNKGKIAPGIRMELSPTAQMPPGTRARCRIEYRTSIGSAVSAMTSVTFGPNLKADADQTILYDAQDPQHAIAVEGLPFPIAVSASRVYATVPQWHRVWIPAAVLGIGLTIIALLIPSAINLLRQ